MALPRVDDPWIVNKVLPVGGVSVLFGNPKCGKSFAAIQLACAVAGTSTEWLGIGVHHHGPVLYLQIDMSRQDWLNRYVDPGVASGHDVSNIWFEDKKTLPYPFNLLNGGHEYLKKGIESMIVSPVLVIIDTLRDMHSGDENDSSVMRNVITTVRAAIGDAALLLVHHARKLLADTPADIIQDLRGSSGLSGSMDGFLRLYSIENSKEGLLTYKSRAADQTTINLKRLPNGYWRTELSAEIEAIQDVVRNFPNATQQQQNILIGQRLGLSESTARRRREELGLL